MALYLGSLMGYLQRVIIAFVTLGEGLIELLCTGQVQMVDRLMLSSTPTAVNFLQKSSSGGAQKVRDSVPASPRLTRGLQKQNRFSLLISTQCSRVAFLFDRD